MVNIGLGAVHVVLGGWVDVVVWGCVGEGKKEGHFFFIFRVEMSLTRSCVLREK